MATKKNTKKTKKYDMSKYNLVIDLTNATEPVDVYRAFAESKLTQNELDAVVETALDTCGIKVYVQNTCTCCKKKPNIFKRFWNWITRKK